jgi:VanZ family protein
MCDKPESQSSDPRGPADSTSARPSQPRRLAAWLPVVLWAGVIFALSSIPGTRLRTMDLPQFDKIVHALLYGVLGGLLCRALDRSRAGGPARSHVLLAILIATAYGVTDEIHQLWTPQRSADWRDVVADACGATLGAAVPGAMSLVAMRWMKFRGCFMMVRSKNRKCSPTREPR